jgi:hypothetical protein
MFLMKRLFLFFLILGHQFFRQDETGFRGNFLFFFLKYFKNISNKTSPFFFQKNLGCRLLEQDETRLWTKNGIFFLKKNVWIVSNFSMSDYELGYRNVSYFLFFFFIKKSFLTKMFHYFFSNLGCQWDGTGLYSK